VIRARDRRDVVGTFVALVVDMRILTFAPAAALIVAFLHGCTGSTDDGSLGNGGGSQNGGGGGSHGFVQDDAGAPSSIDGGASTSDAATTPDGALSNDGAASTDAMPPVGALTPLQKHKAEMLTSIWENSTTVLQYPYCQNIKDGRGYTSGRAGFCSGTGDAIQVVECFDAAFGNANNPMAKYMPALVTLNDRFNATGQDQGGTTELDAVGNYCTDWAKTAGDAATMAQFKACQDQITDVLYFKPGLAQAKKWGLVTALTIAELYDAEINHGDDGVAALIKQANTDVGNSAQKAPTSPLALADESAWLHAFLMRRLKLLKSDATWVQSEDRVVTYERLRLDNDFDLGAQIRTNTKAVTLFPGQGYVDSGYPDCIIAPAGAVSGDAACTSPIGQ
jgi:chitosanase